MRDSVRAAPGARPSPILASKLLSAPAAARAAVGNKEAVRRRLRRQKRGVQPIEPATLQDIAVMRTTADVLGSHVQHVGCLYHLTQSTWRKVVMLWRFINHLNTYLLTYSQTYLLS